MHFYFFLRGINNQVELFKILAQSQFWKWKRTNLQTGKEEVTLVQGALRPSILGTYEYVFPEECLSELISVLGIEREMPRMFWLRRAINCKKIPKKNFEEAKKIPPTLSVNNSWRGLSDLRVAGVHIIPIGIKKDVRGEMYGYNQEGL